jgi:hypothetical protein
MEDMIKEEFKLLGYALVLYAVPISLYWLFVA